MQRLAPDTHYKLCGVVRMLFRKQEPGNSAHGPSQLLVGSTPQWRITQAGNRGCAMDPGLIVKRQDYGGVICGEALWERFCSSWLRSEQHTTRSNLQLRIRQQLDSVLLRLTATCTPL